jgi:hypothetical protein
MSDVQRIFAASKLAIASSFALYSFPQVRAFHRGIASRAIRISMDRGTPGCHRMSPFFSSIFII